MASAEPSTVGEPARVARVYGRAAKAAEPTDLAAQPRGRELPSGSDSDGERPPSVAHKFGQWKAQLAAIDAEFDSDDDAPAQPRVKPLARTVPLLGPASEPTAVRRLTTDHTSSPSSSQRGDTSLDYSAGNATANATTPDTSPSTSPIELLAGLADKPSRFPASRPQSPDSSRDVSAPKARATSAAPQRKKKATTDKPAKPKRLTKKEEAEMKRETARMLSDQRVSLSRGTRDTRLSLSDLTAKLSSKVKPRKGASADAPQLAQRAPSSPIDMFSSSSALDDLAAAAAPSFIHDPKRPIVKPKDLNALLLKRSRAQAAKARQEKEEDWVSRGGVLKRPEDEEAMKESQATVVGEAEEDEARDPDWKPDAAQGDADVESTGSESEREDDPGLGSGEEDGEDVDAEMYTEPPPAQRPVEEAAGDTEDEDENVPPPPKALVKRRAVGVVADSDSENDTAPRERILVAGSSFVIPRRPTSPSASESEKDKENSEFRKFDVSADKENRAAPRLVSSVSPPLPLARVRSRSIISDEENENKENAPRALTSQRPPLSTVSRRYTYDGSLPRAVFGVLETEERPKLAELSLDSPQRPGDGSPLQRKRPAPRPLDDDDLGGGFTQLFEQDEPPRGRPTIPRSLSASMPRRLFEGFRPTESQQTLQFTPTQNRRAGPQMSETQRRRDDEIMAMDMEDVTSGTPAPKEPEWYINDNGLMTQTRPSFTPIAPTPVPALSAPFGSSVLAPSPFDHDAVTPSSERVMRRLKRKSSPQPLFMREDDAEFFSPTGKRPEKRPRNAFEVLREGAKNDVEKVAKKKLPSEYVQDQADESDDETGLGFGGVKAGDDEDVDEEAMKAAVEGMMDDQQMDVDTLAEDLILEKHKEHLDQDDLKLQELHEKAIRGDMRKKKGRGGLNLEDDSSDEEGLRRPRPSKHARNIENDSLPDLAKNPKTKAFFEAYQSATVDDDMIVLPELDLGGSDDEDEGQVEAAAKEGGSETEEIEEPAPRLVSAKELRQELLSAAKKPSTAIDPEDVDWLNDEYDDDDQMDLEVEEVPRMLPPSDKAWTTTDTFDRDLILKRSTTSSTKLQSWAKQESANKSFSTRRTGAASAVTGHAAPSRMAGSSSTASAVLERRNVKAVAQAKRSVNGLSKFLEKKRQS